MKDRHPKPTLEYRKKQPFVAIHAQATMDELRTVIPPLLNEVSVWLDKKGVPPSGAPFVRYLCFNQYEGNLHIDIEVGIPVETTMPGNDRIISDVIPPGRYAILTHTGPYDNLRYTTASLLEWGEKNDITWRTSRDEKSWETRLEYYLTDPSSEPNPQKWQTEIAILVTEKPE